MLAEAQGWLEALPEATALLDDAGSVLAHNDEFLRLLGTSERCVGEPIVSHLELRLGLTAGAAAELSRMIADAKPSFRVEAEACRDESTKCYVVDGRALPMPGVRCRLLQIRCMTHEWAQRRALERQLAMLEVLIDAIPGPVFYKDEDGIYRGCNRAFEQYIGLPRERVIGASVYDISPKELADKYRAMDQSLLRSREKQVYESQVRYADGSLHDVMFHKATFDHADGSVAGIVGVMLDITQRKQVEGELKRSEDVLRKQQAWLEQQNQRMSAPILALGEGLLVLPIMGAFGAHRARLLSERLLRRVAESSCRAVFVDVTGLEEIDLEAADALLRLSRAVKLLGASCWLTGLGADTARTLLALGADLGSIRTFGSLAQALHAFAGPLRARGGQE
ncbi:STAS domain-containing protein [Polyangium aurulentum]|uniref:STAS domain-containing protein n=1 Tax=Polyangium aurulentum TaxID=2567896 RepID=UPI0010AE9858|nr:STAS domain-containing protein [Polyangium aurulentum]UQA54665.1 PAS domain-containing protein [Polyangium aurulentum]